MEWCICHFQIDDSVEVVPNNWITGKNLCVWPLTTKPSKLLELIKRKEIPKDDWKTMNIKILGRNNDYKIAQRKCKTALDRDNLSSLSESAEYGKGCRVPKRKRQYSDTYTDTDTESDECGEKDLSINFPTYKADKTGISSNSNNNVGQVSESNKKQNSDNILTEIRTNKSNNNVYQIGESKKQNSDNILAEIHTNFQKHAIEMKEFQRQVLRHLHSINGRMGELNEHVESLKQSNFLVDQENTNQNIINEVSLQYIENLPVKSKMELQEIERTLQDKGIFHDVATELSKMGGSNLRIIVKKLMCRILTPEIGREYSWEGHKGNLIFKDLLLAKLVLKSVRLTTRKSPVIITDDEIINIVKTWLVKAKLKTKPTQQNKANRSCNSEH
ncbi:uncharacterized protein LOC114930866 isoform X1 [Nylanderia fulva]|uniref:uncharacterized protein LOC114930866 isoform X1 n=1 Tax=Nylanderia fulva TaxID=613905 RepID=UPI0010FB4AF0|nr:uncharacterized protein LOC114930866 isoform X1 [Nylanderia fulva]XP_029158554.1 uncharacterized protein LOC114930866 isoform X1 [Nylanderia fulva]